MQWVEHTDQAIAQANHTQKLLVDMETGLRGYLVTGNQNFLKPYRQASSSIEPAFNDFSRLIRDNPSQQQRLTKLRSHYQDWHRFNARQTFQMEYRLRRADGDIAGSWMQGTPGSMLMVVLLATFSFPYIVGSIARFFLLQSF